MERARPRPRLKVSAWPDRHGSSAYESVRLGGAVGVVSVVRPPIFWNRENAFGSMRRWGSRSYPGQLPLWGGVQARLSNLVPEPRALSAAEGWRPDHASLLGKLIPRGWSRAPRFPSDPAAAAILRALELRHEGAIPAVAFRRFGAGRLNRHQVAPFPRLRARSRSRAVSPFPGPDSPLAPLCERALVQDRNRFPISLPFGKGATAFLFRRACGTRALSGRQATPRERSGARELVSARPRLVFLH